MKEKQKQELYCIHDPEEEECVFAIGTKEQLKEWWWDELVCCGEIGGYKLEPFGNYTNDCLGPNRKVVERTSRKGGKII
jgi:hypothetical protein